MEYPSSMTVFGTWRVSRGVACYATHYIIKMKRVIDVYVIGRR